MRHDPKHVRLAWIREGWVLILVALVVVAGIVAALLLSQGSGTGY
jgi:hypothetical protein